jgi:hypothetical protein
MARPPRWAAVMLSTVLFAGAAGCSRSDPVTADIPPASVGPATTTAAPTTAAGAGVTYKLPASLCAAADQSALEDIFPTGGGAPIADSPGLCATSRSSPAMAVSLSIDAELARTEKDAKVFFDGARRLARSTPTDLPGVGSGAFWTAEKNNVKLISYHGNLVLTITCEPVSSQRQLPASVPERLGRVAAGTFGRLTP